MRLACLRGLVRRRERGRRRGVRSKNKSMATATANKCGGALFRANHAAQSPAHSRSSICAPLMIFKTLNGMSFQYDAVKLPNFARYNRPPGAPRSNSLVRATPGCNPLQRISAPAVGLALAVPEIRRFLSHQPLAAWLHCGLEIVCFVTGDFAPLSSAATSRADMERTGSRWNMVPRVLSAIFCQQSHPLTSSLASLLAVSTMRGASTE
ncbi:hypothetical protein D9619_013750 [Psilocybe cf. subviscida]|uniref:Uncharacterized protein n=1 Tax=Psilocybe cf. subviscida TaxID=2480587 RepID=A0A8H5B705_9AGAR|nr:hypothetical protein D9619_013750 [Psilocybe cf. subviscida]